MSAVEHDHPVVSVPTPLVPPLRHGDRLSRDEFERRYAAMPHVKKAELIEGVVYMPSPVRYARHGNPHLTLSGWIVHYVSKSPGLQAGDNVTNRLGEKDEPQPDVMLFLPPHAGGSAVIDKDDYVAGAPELVCEVTASTKGIDLGVKKTAYCRHGVKEYLVWRVEDRAVDWFAFDAGKYDAMQPNNEGVLCSKVFPGLWLHVEALLTGNLPQLFTTVDQGTSTEDHREFLRRIKPPAD